MKTENPLIMVETGIPKKMSDSLETKFFMLEIQIVNI